MKKILFLFVICNVFLAGEDIIEYNEELVHTFYSGNKSDQLGI